MWYKLAHAKKLGFFLKKHSSCLSFYILLLLVIINGLGGEIKLVLSIAKVL